MLSSDKKHKISSGNTFYPLRRQLIIWKECEKLNGVLVVNIIPLHA